jgi:hypothetical protein
LTDPGLPSILHTPQPKNRRIPHFIKSI